MLALVHEKHPDGMDRIYSLIIVFVFLFNFPSSVSGVLSFQLVKNLTSTSLMDENVNFQTSASRQGLY